MEVESPMGSGSPIFDLKQSPDGSITGTYQGRLGEATVKGKIKGNISPWNFLSVETSLSMMVRWMVIP